MFLLCSLLFSVSNDTRKKYYENFIVSIGLFFYAKTRISDRINQLTEMVRNPHLFKTANLPRAQNAGPVGRKPYSDEIDKLVNIFSKFYNEEKSNQPK